MSCAPVARVGVASLRVLQQSVLCGRLKRDQARFSELGLANGEQTLLQIDILPFEREGFTDPQPRHREQTEETVVGPTAQTVARR